MRRRAGLIVLAVAAVVLAVAGCGGSPVPDRDPDVTGVVARSASGAILTEPSDPYFDQMSLLRGDPVLIDQDGDEVPYGELAEGDAIEVWIDGACAESFPVQCTVTALRVGG